MALSPVLPPSIVRIPGKSFAPVRNGFVIQPTKGPKPVIAGIDALLSSASSTPTYPVTGEINGWTSAPVPAQQPPVLYVDFGSCSGSLDFQVTISCETATPTFYFATSDPGLPNWIDTSSFSTSNDYLNGFLSAIGAYSGSFTGVPSADTCILTDLATGSASFINGSATAYAAVRGGGNGTDYQPSSGAVDENQFASQIGGLPPVIANPTTDKIFTANGVNTWTGLLQLIYFDGIISQSVFEVDPSLVTDGTYSLDDIQAIASFFDPALLATGIPSGNLVLHFIPAIDIDVSMPGPSTQFSVSCDVMYS